VLFIDFVFILIIYVIPPASKWQNNCGYCHCKEKRIACILSLCDSSCVGM